MYIAYMILEQAVPDKIILELSRHTHMQFPHTLHFVANLLQIAMRTVHKNVVENVIEGRQNLRSVR